MARIRNAQIVAPVFAAAEVADDARLDSALDIEDMRRLAVFGWDETDLILCDDEMIEHMCENPF